LEKLFEQTEKERFALACMAKKEMVFVFVLVEKWF
jgi:hypothetical protein